MSGRWRSSCWTWTASRDQRPVRAHDGATACSRWWRACWEHTSGKTDIAARYGGDEFAVILPETDLSSAAVIAERIAMGSRTSGWTSGESVISFTASVGYASCGHDSPGRAEILDTADRLMFESKRRGPGGVLGVQI